MLNVERLKNLMMTAAAMIATAMIHVTAARQSPQLESLRQVLIDRFLELLHFGLGRQKTLRDGIVHERFTVFFKVGNLRIGKRQAHLLLLLKRLAFDVERVVLGAGVVVAHETIHAFLEVLELRLVEDGLAEFARFLDDDCFVGVELHNV